MKKQNNIGNWNGTILGCGITLAVIGGVVMLVEGVNGYIIGVVIASVLGFTVVILLVLVGISTLKRNRMKKNEMTPKKPAPDTRLSPKPAPVVSPRGRTSVVPAARQVPAAKPVSKPISSPARNNSKQTCAYCGKTGLSPLDTRCPNCGEPLPSAKPAPKPVPKPAPKPAAEVSLRESLELTRRKHKSLMRQTDRTLNDDEDIAVFEEKHLCIVHKGPVDSLAFICPSCGSFYCKACFDAVVEADNACWSCGRPLDASKPSKRAEPEHQAGESQGKKAKKKTAINKDS